MTPRAAQDTEIFELWSDAVRAADAAALARLHLPGGILQAPEGEAVRGRADIGRALAEWFGRPGFGLRIHDLEWKRFPSNDIASGSAEYELEYHDARGRWVRDAGRVLVVAVETAGSWGVRFNAFFSQTCLREIARPGGDRPAQVLAS